MSSREQQEVRGKQNNDTLRMIVVVEEEQRGGWSEHEHNTKISEEYDSFLPWRKNEERKLLFGAFLASVFFNDKYLIIVEV